MDKRTCLYLEMKVIAGTDIAEAAMEACNVAQTLGTGVEFMFNGVCCMTHPGGDYEALIENWRIAGGQYPMANAYRRAPSANGGSHD